MEWNKDNIEDIVKYINSELTKGRTMISIEQEDFNANERVIDKRLKRAGYKKIDNKYIINEDVIQKKDKSKTKEKDKSNNSNTLVIQRPNNLIIDNFKEIDMNSLKEIINLLEPMKEVIQEYNKSKIKDSVIDLEPLEIKIDRTELSGNIKAAGFRIDENILDLWKEFTSENKAEYKVQDLVGQALLEFMEKYKK